MLGHKTRNFRPLTEVSLEDLVPEDNFYRQVERTIYLSFVRDLADDFYSKIGRPSIDPVVFFKLQLIAFFESIRSERQLMETVNLNLAHRWFIGYDLDEPVPDHSSLSKIKERYGLEVFQQFFEHIVEPRIETGLVWGEELYLVNFSPSTMAKDFMVSASHIINGLQIAESAPPIRMLPLCSHPEEAVL